MALHVAGDDFLQRGDIWTTKSVKAKGLGGRGAIALFNATQWWGTSIVLRRKIEITADCGDWRPTSPMLNSIEAASGSNP
ncbi:hypothetical protein NKH84_24055 [Mesorhizobium sp. M0902]|uniref:hypothetical protein n=1 Tax=unclassified Mesorhizobium TaxID=325217 RepID=UPI0033397310